MGNHLEMKKLKKTYFEKSILHDILIEKSEVKQNENDDGIPLCAGL